MSVAVGTPQFAFGHLFSEYGFAPCASTARKPEAFLSWVDVIEMQHIGPVWE